MCATDDFSAVLQANEAAVDSTPLREEAETSLDRDLSCSGEPPSDGAVWAAWMSGVLSTRFPVAGTF